MVFEFVHALIFTKLENLLWEEQLLQMQKQYKLITPGSSVLDLGCAPGAWLQVNFSLLINFFSIKVCVFFLDL